eukprot:4932484-Ditylum_brightwellii.AAC.1
MDDSRFNSVCTTIKTLALQTKTPINYASYLQSLITHVENFKSSTSKVRESNKLESLQGGAKKKGDKDNWSNKPWKNDYSAW